MKAFKTYTREVSSRGSVRYVGFWLRVDGGTIARKISGEWRPLSVRSVVYEMQEVEALGYEPFEKVTVRVEDMKGREREIAFWLTTDDADAFDATLTYDRTGKG